MKNDYKFINAKRGAVIAKPVGKTRITILIDTDILEKFRERAHDAGHGYQTLINQALREYVNDFAHPVSAGELRAILREELQASGRS